MSGSVDNYHYQWCPRDDPEFRRLNNNPVCICDALSDAMRDATREVLADLRTKVEGLPPHGQGEKAFVWRDDVLALIEEVDRG